MKSILVIGLDGATWKTLPSNYFSFLENNIFYGVSQSTFPPLTPSVWTSFLTGTNPGKHAIFGFLNYRKAKSVFFQNKDIMFPLITEIIKDRSYISFKDLNGLMVEAGIESQEVEIEKLLKTARQKVEAFKKSSQKAKSQFNFILFKEVDKAQHLYWGSKKLEKFYLGLQPILEDLVSFYQKEAKFRGERNILILSDHGFHHSAKKQFSVYPWLIKEGYLTKEPNFIWEVIHKTNSLLKSLGIDFSRNSFFKAKRKKIVSTIEAKIKKQKILATFEGLYIFDDKLNRKNLLGKLRKLKVFKKLYLCQDIYKGAHFNQGPDIIWLPKEKFQINISPLERNVFSLRPTDIPGDHISDTKGIFLLAANKTLKISSSFPKKLNITDLGAMVYDLLNRQKPAGLDGLSPIHSYVDLDRKIARVRKIMFQTFEKYGDKFAIAFTGRKDSLVMLDILRQINRKLPRIIFIDHREHFPESLKFLKFIAKKWQLEITYIKTKKKNGETLAQAKIRALAAAIKNYKLLALMSAIRRDEHQARKNETYFSKRPSHMRIQPILELTERDIWDYIKRYNLDYNPLYDQGYRSLEEKSETKKVYDARQSERLGRAKNKEKIMEKLRKLGYF